MDSNHILRIFSPAHTPCLPSVHGCGSRKIRTFGPLKRLGPLAEGWFRPLTHASFVYLPSINELKIDTAKLYMLNAAYLRSEKISQIFMCFRIFVLVFVPMLMFMFMFMFMPMLMPMLMPKMSIITSKSTVNCTFTSVRYLNLDENYV